MPCELQTRLSTGDEHLACAVNAVAAPAFGTSRGTAGAGWSRDGAHSGSLLIMLKYQFFSSRGTSWGTAFPAGARAPTGPGVERLCVNGVQQHLHLIKDVKRL